MKPKNKPTAPQLPSASKSTATASNTEVKAAKAAVPKAATAKKPKEKEYTLDPRPPPLTLAQRLGLVERPKERLSENEWQKVKEQSNKRADSTEPCVVCKEHFGLQPQVLLSCSHVFHRACLEAFERFSGKRCCPLCRRAEYEKRVIFEGARNYRQRAATLIQATWRGYRVRKAYLAFRAAHPPNDPNLRRKFYESKLSSIAEQMVRNCEENERSADLLVAEVDANLAQFKRVVALLGREPGEARSLDVSPVDWTAVEQRAVQRDDQQCPICLTKMAVRLWFDLPETAKQPQATKAPSKSTTNGRKDVKQSAENVKARHKPLALLSCSHVFHRGCIDTFEELTVMDAVRNVDRTHIRQCPVCRTPYCRQVCREMTLQRC